MKDTLEAEIIALVHMGQAQLLISRMGGADDVAELSRERGTDLTAATLLNMTNTVENARQVVEAVGGVSAVAKEIDELGRRTTQPASETLKDEVIALVHMGKAQVLISRMGGAHDVAELSRERGEDLAAATFFNMTNTVENARQVVEAVGGVSAVAKEIDELGKRNTQPSLETLRDHFMKAVRDYQPDDKPGFAAIIRDAQSLGVSPDTLGDTFEVSAGTVGRWSRGISVPTRVARVSIVERIGGMISPQKA